MRKVVKRLGISVGALVAAFIIIGIVVAATGGGTTHGQRNANTKTSASTARTSTTSAKAVGISTSGATSFWRRQVAFQYDGTVPTDDGRGCAQAAKGRWVCTAYVRTPSEHNVDVYGTVIAIGTGMTVEAHRVPSNNGGVIERWFNKTGGGCQTASCSGTRF
jgi:hypothetical protein